MDNLIRISPSKALEIIDRIENTLNIKYSDTDNIVRYFSRWHESYDSFGNDNFFLDKSYNFDIKNTLDSMNDELLFKIAVDLKIEIPGLIYSIAEIKTILSQNYEDAGNLFEQACKKIYTDPSSAASTANSALELIIKRISSDTSIPYNSKDTLYKLTETITKNVFPGKALDEKIRNLVSGLLTSTQAIEQIRSQHTDAHGHENISITDPIYAMFIVNSVTTIGLFLLNYSGKYQNKDFVEETEDVPF